MGVQQTAVNTAFSFPSGTVTIGNFDESPEDFAELVRQDEVAAALFVRDRQRMMERDRIAQVGFAQYAREQYEIRKMMRLMSDFAENASHDLQREFDVIIADLEANPPYEPTEMYARIEGAIARMPESVPNFLKRRMKEAYAEIREEMEKPDSELERLEKTERQKCLQAHYRPEALMTAAFL